MSVAGWYDDPLDPSALRWWDGAVWSGSTHPRAATAPVAPGWYERPETPGVHDWWDGSRWVDRDDVEITDLETIDLDVDLRDIPLDRHLGSPAVPLVVHHAAGWYADPSDAYAWRWWDGAEWTAHTHTTHAQAVPAL